MREWVFITNPAHFRMQEALVPGETLDWPTFGKFKFAVGDIVFFYASTPVAQMVGKLEIEENALDFSAVDPRNDLRKWPRRFSKIPWLRLRVLQAAPVPFKPLQSRSLYYHTGFKPSPYPKLLHEAERDYVHRAFDRAMTYTAETLGDDGPLEAEALAKVARGELLRAAADRLAGGRIEALQFDDADNALEIKLVSTDGADRLSLHCRGVVLANWTYDTASPHITAVRLETSDIYLRLSIAGILDILTDAVVVD